MSLRGEDCRRGQAMVVCLVAIAFLSAVLGASSMILLTYGRKAAYDESRLAAFYLARSGLESGYVSLQRDDQSYDTLRDGWNLNAGQNGNALGDGRFGLGQKADGPGLTAPPVIDEERKLNINRATQSMLMALSPAIGQEAAAAIVQRRGHRPFVSLAELHDVSGFNRKLLEEASAPGSDWPLCRLLTAHGIGKLNVNTASLATLRCVPGLGKEGTHELLKRRRGPDNEAGTGDDRAFSSRQQLLQWLKKTTKSWQTASRWLTVRSTCFTLRAWGRSEKRPPATFLLKTVVRRMPKKLEIIEFRQNGE